jgi:cytoskeletal protein CcmA (bactofilin family)
MFNKDQQNPDAPQAPSTPRSSSSEQTRIGRSVALKGTLKCDEDLRLEGRLEGAVSVPQHRVVIGASGQVKADVHARVIEVEGRVLGDLVGAERVVVASSGNVQGNIRAPRVSLENGAQFKGSIDMDPGNSSSDTGSAERKGPKQSVSPAARVETVVATATKPSAKAS